MTLFFFSSRRRHTSLVSDWSSDVCSSDLGNGSCSPGADPLQPTLDRSCPRTKNLQNRQLARSEERRVGKECRSRWAACHKKENEQSDLDDAVYRTERRDRDGGAQGRTCRR